MVTKQEFLFRNHFIQSMLGPSCYLYACCKLTDIHFILAAFEMRGEHQQSFLLGSANHYSRAFRMITSKCFRWLEVGVDFSAEFAKPLI